MMLPRLRMMWPRLRRLSCGLIAGAGLTAIVTMGPATVCRGQLPEADASHPGFELSIGDASRGILSVPIYRGGIVPYEFYLVATPGNCQRRVQVTLAWNEAENWVRIRIKGRRVLERFPDVDRTEGVNFFPNPLWPEPEDIEDGRYLLWLISAPGLTTFYYDVNTLALLGSEFDFATPPVPSIPIEVPHFTAIPTPYFQPDEHGNVDVVHQFAYDGLVRPDLPNQAHTLGTFVPLSLCEADPFRFDRTSVVPFSSARPASDALTWRDYLENGLAFDLTVEPATYFTFPPVSTNIGAYQGSVATAGNVPKGWTVDLEAFFGSIAPPIVPLPTAPFPGETCEDWFKPGHNPGFNVCGPPPGGGP